MCNGQFAGFQRRAVLLASLWLIAWPAYACGAADEARVVEGSRAALIPIHGEINEITLDSIERRLKRVRAEAIPLVIFELDTPGGALDATLKICSAIKAERDRGVRVYAWIHDEAYSAGTIIALATDGIVMSPNATIGDCQPIRSGPDGVSVIPEELQPKAFSPLLAELRDSIRRNGYDTDLVMALIRPDTQVFWVENRKTGERRFVGADQRDQLMAKTTSSTAPANGGTAEAAWTYVEEAKGLGRISQPIKERRELLTLRTPEAAAIGWSQATLSSEADLREHFHISGWVGDMGRTWWEALVTWLASPMVRGVLFILIVLGAYAEFHAPGMSLPGAVAIVSLVLYLGAPYLAGLTVTWEIIAVLAGLILIALELFVIPGFGVAGITGLLLLALGFIASFLPQDPGYGPWTPHWPRTSESYRYLRQGLWSLAGGAGGSVIGMLVLSRILPRLPVASRLVLKNPTREQVIPEDPHANVGRLGDIGLSESLLRPAGKARFGAALLDVISEGEYIPRGERVEVVQREGSRVVVRRVD